MPELPEIETIKRVIEPQIRGLAIEKITVHRPEVIAHPVADAFCRAVTGQVIVRMARRGKFLQIELENQSRLLLHLRMTGCLLVVPQGCPMEKHTHLVFHLQNGTELRFSDARRFGRFWLIQAGEEDVYSGIAKLGVEPLEPACSADYLQRKFGPRKKAIKSCLMDQHVIAGIGNIDADEILFRAGLHPARPAGNLSRADWETLAAVIPDCLSYLIAKNRITAQEYAASKGRDYRSTPYLQVYGHDGQPCPLCGVCLCRMVIGGRSSVYCPACQKA